VVGTQPIDPGTVARILKARAAAEFHAAVPSGHSLKRSMAYCSERRAVSSRRSAAHPSHRISPTGMRRPGTADASSASVGPCLVTAV
jgi:hypothetical protein